MKRFFFSIALLLIIGAASAQSKNHKLGIAIGGGPQDYCGERGNGFTGSDGVWRGGGVLHIGYYLNRSFDVALISSMGDIGYCPDDVAANTEVPEDDQCPGCAANGIKGIGSLSGRLTTGGLALRYKFANGYLLKESSRFQPYAYAGVAYAYISDPMKMDCIKVGSYMTYNAGAGVKYQISRRFNVSYHIGFGYFNRDDMDYMSHKGTANDMYMQNSLMVGVDLF